MNGFLRAYARKNHERGASKTFLAVSKENDAILGFYTLSPAEAEFEQVPEKFRKGLGRYAVGGFRLARIAVSRSEQGKGLGGQLLMAAGLRCIRAAAEVGGALMFIDAKDERVAKWYRSYGALSLDDRPLSLFLPLASFEAGLRLGGKV
jgi:GNAT superfamily N-acetyltransferase